MPNITLIGAGSASFSLSLIRDVIVTEGLAGSRMTLVDINEERLNVAVTLANRYRDEAKAALTFSATADRKEGLEGADFVICAVKIGGYGPLEKEREIAEASGYYRGIGDRVSCYYGGVGAYHQLRFLMDLAHDMEAICPDAYLIQTANPVFEATNIVTRCTKIKAVGVCHGHYGYRAIARTLGLDLEDVDVLVAGFNHYVWLLRFMYKGQDAYPLIDKWIEEESEEYWRDGEYAEEMAPGVIDSYRLYGCLPVGDAVRCATPWWHHTTGGGFQGVMVGDFPARVMHNVMIPRWVRMENILEAFLTGDRRPLVLSLMDDGRTQSYEQAKGLIDLLLDQPWNEEAAKHYRW